MRLTLQVSFFLASPAEMDGKGGGGPPVDDLKSKVVIKYSLGV